MRNLSDEINNVLKNNSLEQGWYSNKNCICVIKTKKAFKVSPETFSGYSYLISQVQLWFSVFDERILSILYSIFTEIINNFIFKKISKKNHNLLEV